MNAFEINVFESMQQRNYAYTGREKNAVCKIKITANNWFRSNSSNVNYFKENSASRR